MRALVIGGAGHGKLDYATEAYQLSPQDIGDCKRSPDPCALNRPCVYGLEALVLHLLERGENPAAVILSAFEDRANWIILCDEIGGGIVPAERLARDWREHTGRICCELARRADKVTRVFCGIPTDIKDVDV